MTTTKNQIQNQEVNNEVNNNKTSNINNSFKASIYQLDKTNSDVTFELILQGTTDKTDNTLFVEVAKLLAKQTFELFNEQNNIQIATNKHRVYKFAATKPVFFYFQLNSETIFNTEFFNSLKVKLSGLTNAEQLQVILDSLIRIITTTNNIEL